MEDIVLIQAIERYLDGSMLPAEKAYFEELRANNSNIDQMVVEHSMFLHQMENFSIRQNFTHDIQQVHAKLLAIGEITEAPATTQGKIISLFHRYKKVTAIAASVGGIMALVISVLVTYFGNTYNNGTVGVSRELFENEINNIKQNQAAQNKALNEVKSKLPENQRYVNVGTGFLIDAKGYLVTNAHVLKGSGANVVDNEGNEYKTKIVHIDAAKDLAILKIDDADFTAPKSLPYSIKPTASNLGQEIYTLGFPRNEIVYNQGYLSAKTGFNNDTTSYQIQLDANPGNSGGPILNKEGEVIGILSAKQTTASGISFAIKTKYLVKMIDALKKEDTTVQKIKLPSYSQITDNNRENQVKKVQNCVFLVKAYSK